MSKLTRRSVVLAKVEATYGVDAAPGVSNGVLVNNGVEIQPQAEIIERDQIRDSLSPQGFVVGAKQLTFNMEVELKGGGVVTNVLQAPEFDPLLQACGMKFYDTVTLSVTAIPTGLKPGDTVTGDTSSATGTVLFIQGTNIILRGVTGTFTGTEKINSNAATINASPVKGKSYSPVSDPAAMKSATIYFYKDGILHKALGCRGNMELNCPVGQIPTIKFTMNGVWADPADQATPSPTFVSQAPPVCTNLGLSVAGFSPVANSLTLNMGNDIVARKDLNSAEGVVGLMLKGRKPTGSIDPEVDTLAAYNPWSAWKAATPGIIKATIGSVPGNTIDIYIPKATYGDMKYADRDGIAVYNIGFSAVVEFSDDEVRFLFR